jgi:hypothetical protein
MATLAVAFLFVAGAWAQHTGTTLPGTSAMYAPNTTQGTTYVMVGSTVPMWVMPDPYFHPNYDPSTGVYTLNDEDFEWNWTVPAGLSYTQSSVNDNYITVTGVTVGGPYTVSVAETAPVAFGGCAGAAQNLTVNVVAQPTFALSSGLDGTFTFCEGNAGLPTAINTTLAGGWQNYRLAWNLTITTLDAGGTPEFWYTNNAGAGQNNALTYAVNHTTDETTNPFEAVGAATATHNIMTVPSFLVIDNNGAAAGGDAVTVYTYTLVSINDQASRYGNFIALDGDETDAAAFTYYAATAAADQVVVTVYPAPVTGPIYHINNNWAD